MNRRLVLGLCVGVAVIGAGVAWKVSVPDAAPVATAEPPPVAVDVAPATIGAVRNVLHAVGALTARQSVPISPQSAGTVDRVMFKEGGLVDKDAPLVRLDPRIAQAQYDAAAAQLKVAQERFDRITALAKTGFSSKQSLDDVTASYGSAQSDMAVRRTELDLLTLHAPFKGVVGQQLFGVGQYVTAGKTLVWLEDREALRVSFTVPERYYDKLYTGQPFATDVDARPGMVFHGLVAFVDPRPDRDEHNIEVRGEIDNADGKLTSGLFSRVSLVIDEHPKAVVILPAAAQYTLIGAYVYKLDGDRVRRTPITIGYQMDDRIEVLDGLKSGDVVVTVGALNLDDGRRVHVVNHGAGPV